MFYYTCICLSDNILVQSHHIFINTDISMQDDFNFKFNAVVLRLAHDLLNIKRNHDCVFETRKSFDHLCL